MPERDFSIRSRRSSSIPESRRTHFSAPHMALRGRCSRNYPGAWISPRDDKAVFLFLVECIFRVFWFSTRSLVCFGCAKLCSCCGYIIDGGVSEIYKQIKIKVWRRAFIKLYSLSVRLSKNILRRSGYSGVYSLSPGFYDCGCTGNSMQEWVICNRNSMAGRNEIHSE